MKNIYLEIKTNLSFTSFVNAEETFTYSFALISKFFRNNKDCYGLISFETINLRLASAHHMGYERYSTTDKWKEFIGL